MMLAVVYFHQRTHACASVRIFENDQKHLKMSLKSTFFIMRTRGTREPYKEKRRKKTFFFVFLLESYMSLSYPWWKGYFFIHFWVLLIIFSHIEISKYRNTQQLAYCVSFHYTLYILLRYSKKLLKIWA